ncbi:MAG: hypothetical protein WCA45_16335, partial [Thiobacillaceae bacterium]
MHLIPESVEFIGDWFLPNAENAKKIAGTLSWSTQRASLDLHDAFTPLHGTVYGDEYQSYPVVYGTTIKSQFITMLDATGGAKAWSLGPAGINQTEKVASSLVVVGGHVTPETHYEEIRVRIPGLQMWIGRTGIRRSII